MAARRTLLRKVVLALAALALAAAVALSVVYYEVSRQAGRDEARKADAIVVLGAAQYNGRPSPVLKARLDHALELYDRELANRIIATGGHGLGARFSEGEVSRRYLSEHGVPAEFITVETTGQSTMQSVAVVGEIMDRMQLRSCIVVSDDYHMHRAKKMLEELKYSATQVIDTSSLKPAVLKERIIARFSHLEGSQFSVNITSFGFKYGIPIDADLVFDVRFLPNPHYVEQLRPRTGQDSDVYDYVMKWPETQSFLTKLLDMLHFLIPQYRKEGKSQVIIGIGCTGGKHRSVAISEYLGKMLGASETEVVSVSHRDADRDRH